MPPRAAKSNPRKTGPDLSWEDDDLADQATSHHPNNIPEPTFPPRYIRTPKPLSAAEHRQVNFQLSFRDRCRTGPLFCTLDRSVLLDRHGHANPRAGFDPFASQERYSTRHLVQARTTPDLSETGRGDYGYTLSLYPAELWGVLDPTQRLPGWEGVSEDSIAFASLGRKSTKVKEKRRKRRRIDILELDRVGEDDITAGFGSDGTDEAAEGDEDAVSGAATRKRRREQARLRRDDEATRAHKQKSGLDAEDEYDQADPDGARPAAGAGKEDNDDAEDGEEEPEDDEFEDSDEGGGDYDAEQYFDAGDEDGDGYGDDGGGNGGDY